VIPRLAVYCLLLLLLAALTACGPAAPTVTALPQPTPSATTTPKVTPTPRPMPPPIEPASKLSRRCDQGQSSTARPMVPGEMAIDFALKDTKGTAYTLSSLLAEKPIVLIFGSYSSTAFRQQIASDNAMYKNYGARAGFIAICSKEANPINQNPAEFSRDSRGTPITQPVTYEQRVAWAAKMITETKISMPVLVDEIDNPLWCSYGRMANNAFLIGKDGRIVLRQDWHDAAKLERDLKQYLGIW
jgi:peroxiredoxin